MGREGQAVAGRWCGRGHHADQGGGVWSAGQVVAGAQAGTVCETLRSGWVEVEMVGLWWQVVALCALAGRLGCGHPVRPIGISAFMRGWLTDCDGRLVRSAILPEAAGHFPLVPNADTLTA